MRRIWYFTLDVCEILGVERRQVRRISHQYNIQPTFIRGRDKTVMAWTHDQVEDLRRCRRKDGYNVPG